MGQVMDSVRRVSDLMGEITMASEEQSVGIGQVNLAIGQMDEVTQQNAALVEQAAAAAESLKEQADGLRTTVAEFRLTDEPKPVLAAPPAIVPRPKAGTWSQPATVRRMASPPSLYKASTAAMQQHGAKSEARVVRADSHISEHDGLFVMAVARSRDPHSSTTCRPSFTHRRINGGTGQVSLPEIAWPRPVAAQIHVARAAPVWTWERQRSACRIRFPTQTITHSRAFSTDIPAASHTPPRTILGRFRRVLRRSSVQLLDWSGENRFAGHSNCPSYSRFPRASLRLNSWPLPTRLPTTSPGCAFPAASRPTCWQ
jgi:methyl-accepting chemotaxis protein